MSSLPLAFGLWKRGVGVQGVADDWNWVERELWKGFRRTEGRPVDFGAEEVEGGRNRLVGAGVCKESVTLPQPTAMDGSTLFPAGIILEGQQSGHPSMLTEYLSCTHFH